MSVTFFLCHSLIFYVSFYAQNGCTKRFTSNHLVCIPAVYFTLDQALFWFQNGQVCQPPDLQHHMDIVNQPRYCLCNSTPHNLQIIITHLLPSSNPTSILFPHLHYISSTSLKLPTWNNFRHGIWIATTFIILLTWALPLPQTHQRIGHNLKVPHFKDSSIMESFFEVAPPALKLAHSLGQWE